MRVNKIICTVNCIGSNINLKKIEKNNKIDQKKSKGKHELVWLDHRNNNVMPHFLYCSFLLATLGASGCSPLN